MESHKSDQRAGEPALRGKTEGPKSFLREERGLSGELITELYSTSFRMTTKMTEAPLHEEPWKEDKWQWVRAEVGKALSGFRKELSYVKAAILWNHWLWKSPSQGSFQDVILTGF